MCSQYLTQMRKTVNWTSFVTHYKEIRPSEAHRPCLSDFKKHPLIMNGSNYRERLKERERELLNIWSVQHVRWLILKGRSVGFRFVGWMKVHERMKEPIAPPFCAPVIKEAWLWQCCQYAFILLSHITL